MNLHEEDHDIIRSSRSQMFLKIGVLKKFTIFTGEHLCWTLFLIKLPSFSPATLFKRDSQAGVFLCTLCENFNCTFFLQNTSGGCFFIKRKLSCMSVIFNLTFPFGYLSNADSADANTDSRDATDLADSADSTDSADLADSTESADLADSTDSADSADSTDSADSDL